MKKEHNLEVEGHTIVREHDSLAGPGPRLEVGKFYGPETNPRRIDHIVEVHTGDPDKFHFHIHFTWTSVNQPGRSSLGEFLDWLRFLSSGRTKEEQEAALTCKNQSTED